MRPLYCTLLPLQVTRSISNALAKDPDYARMIQSHRSAAMLPAAAQPLLIETPVMGQEQPNLVQLVLETAGKGLNDLCNGIAHLVISLGNFLRSMSQDLGLLL
jgi:hypothetical protein